MMRILCFALLSPLSLTAFAQSDKAPTPRHSIIYGSPSWNTDATKIDSAFLIIKDKKTSKFVQVQLEETAPDSSEFKGIFNVTLAEEQLINPEVYIPPQNIRGNLDRFYQLIQTGKLGRKPTIIKRSRMGNVIDVYDTREQAEKAWALYQQQRSMAQGRSTNLPVSPVNNSALEKSGALDPEAQARAHREFDRLRLEQIEKKKLEERLLEQSRMDEATKQKRRAEAQRLAAIADKAYAVDDYAVAEENYKKASDLDPENKSFYYKYGVSLYRNEKFNEALVAFNLTPTGQDTDDEKNYFMGLTHYKLKENDKALAAFREAAKSSDPDLGPSALFYEGVILYEKEEYEAAKKPFEKILDVSKDPKLDQQAEDYLEAIANAMVMQKLRSKKWRLTGTAGLMYDSNVLLSPDLVNSQGESQKESDARLLTVGEVTYKAMMNQTSSWDVTAAANLTNSSKNDLASSDPWVYTLSAPYSKQLSGKEMRKISITPGYESLFMAVDGSSAKTNILNSMYANFDYLMVNRPTWISMYTFGYRNDNSSLASSIGTLDLDAHKVNLSTTQTTLLGAKKREALAGTLGITHNAAKGEERVYNRIDVSLMYAKPVWKTASWATSLGYYNLQFPDSTLNRSDNNVTLTTSMAKPIREWFTWGVSGSYSNNVSSESDSFSYSRFTILTTATFNTAF